MKYYLFILFVFTTLASHAQAGHTGGRLFRSFYLGPEGVQFFIRPLKLSSRFPKSRMLADWTFRVGRLAKKDDLSRMNFTIKDVFFFKTPDSLVLLAGGKSYVVRDLEVLFTERSRRFYRVRLAATIPVDILRLWFADPLAVCSLHQGETSRVYRFHSDSRQRKLNLYLFSLL